MRIKSKILIIAGSDSSGGAGIQADIKTATCLGVYSMTAVTAVTVQNTKGVKSVISIPANEIYIGFSHISFATIRWRGPPSEIINLEMKETF